MNTPAHTPTRSDPHAHAQLVVLIGALRVLHKHLLVGMQLAFEKLHGRVETPAALLQLTIHDPLFAWLRPLTQQITTLHDLESEDVDAAVLAEARAAAKRLFDAESEFRASYLVCLQDDPELVIADVKLRQLLE